MRGLMKETHSIIPRRPVFDFAATPSHWIYDDPMASQMLNVINPITPAPERWFCQTFRDALPFVQDQQLKAAVMAFIKQEGAHSYGHTLGTRHIEALGIDLSQYSEMMSWIFNDLLGSKPLGYALKHARLKSMWLNTRLAMVAAAEHLTGVLGHWVLNAEGLQQAPVDQQMLRLLLWHGAEEVEHREVADAMFRHLSNNLVLRTGAAVFTFPLFIVLAYIAVETLVAKDPQLPHRFRYNDYFRAARQDRVPRASYIARACLRYFHPKHSPLNEGSTAQALAYLNNMPEFKPT
ncbi:metal-dependent hydrolase [Acinetobacter gyllenbergii]|uniref:metal-dependent hydrolase n=1 Tax=Acinetobacter gyllenbergii TaxID=134534 RepID=UPI000806D0A2|nr:metal-dependent hydrolase [Acinetobacter gyllenbergii]OBY76112.1 metal-dependent hydrolase [Acinetobacter gyllenbergii]